MLMFAVVTIVILILANTIITILLLLLIIIIMIIMIIMLMIILANICLEALHALLKEDARYVTDFLGEGAAMTAVLRGNL